MTTQPVADAQPAYAAAALEGSVFHAETAVTGVAPGTAIGTTAPFALHNPVGSGVNLILLEASMAYVSGTLGAGQVNYVVNLDPTAAVPTGTAIVARNAKLGGAASAARPLTTATLPASPSLLKPFCSLGASLATTAVQPWQIKDRIDGSIVVPPGYTVSLEGTATAGTSPLVTFGMTWQEKAI